MEENKLNNKPLKAGLIILGVLLLILCLKIAGMFNFFYFHNLKTIFDKNFESFNNFIDSHVKITRSISEDTIIQSALIQSGTRNQVVDTYKYLSLYKQNFSEIRNITLFNSDFGIVLATDVEEHIINKNLNKEWFIISGTKGYYISDISYLNKYNEYLISIIYPIRNIIDENIGFLMNDFSLSLLFNKFDQYKNTVIIIKKQDKFIFTYPLNNSVKQEKDLEKFKKIYEKVFNGDYCFIVAGNNNFYSFPLYLKIVMILLFIVLLLFLIYSLFDSRITNIESRRMRLKKMTQDIVSFSKEVVSKNIQKSVVNKEIQNNIPVESGPKRRETERIGKEESKIHKINKEDKSGFILIE